MSDFLFAFEQPKVFGGQPIEVQARDALSVVVVQQHGAIGLGVTDHDALGAGDPGDDRLNDMEARNLEWTPLVRQGK
ncbi:hypothetical protein ACFW16_35325 [Inquilinus sp. NPDC058860]|uniref:hypothetical protein n=1 Tax=Inquilinus sp. NPDC058860 TaxID=3346652 RepID=UPI0036CBF303